LQYRPFRKLASCRGDNRGWIVTTKCRRDPQAEISVMIAVDVGELNAIGFRDKHRRMTVEISHPGHRNAVRH
jgi:hypothetical protein